jgi:cytoskeletal protein RodZ
VVKVINIAAGLLIFILAAGLVVWYLGIGRQRQYTPANSEQNVQPASSSPDQSGVTPTSVDSQSHSAAPPEVAESDTKARAASKPAPLANAGQVAQPLVETATPAAIPAPPEATKPTRINPAPAPPSSDEHVKRGRDLLNSGSYDRALVEFRSASRLEPANDDVHYLAGVAHDKLGQRSEALEEFSRCKSGPYASLASQHVKRLNKQLGKGK